MKNFEFSDKICVKMSDINLEPGPFCMSFGFDLRPLIESLKTAGMVNTPAVIIRPDGKWDVAIGYRRILALHALRETKVICNVLRPAHFTPRRILLMNLHDNMSTRSFNHVEKGMVLNR